MGEDGKLGVKVNPGELVRIVRNIFTNELVLREDFDAEYEPLDLVCDNATQIVYYKFTRKKYVCYNDKFTATKVGYMSIFLGPNGRPCSFVDGQIYEKEEGGKLGIAVKPGELCRISKNIFTGELAIREKFDGEYVPLDLVCDSETQIVYHKLTRKKHIRHHDKYSAVKIGQMAIFLGPNCRACRFVDGQIYEIV